MRLYIQTTPNKALTPFNYQPHLVEVIHKWLGITEPSGKPALYSFSWLLNAKVNANGLDYPKGANFFISFHDDTHLKQVIKSIMSHAEMCFGMQIADVTIKENPDLTNKTLFQCASPIFVQGREDGKDIHYTYKDEISGKFLKQMLYYKMELAGLPKDEDLRIRFDSSSACAKTKIVDYKGIKNRTNLCPVIIEGKPETKVFAWNVGLGNSTGIGFGAIY
jgi:CRISPR-associated endoribonuclease Cas6